MIWPNQGGSVIFFAFPAVLLIKLTLFYPGNLLDQRILHWGRGDKNGPLSISKSDLPFRGVSWKLMIAIRPMVTPRHYLNHPKVVKRPTIGFMSIRKHFSRVRENRSSDFSLRFIYSQYLTGLIRCIHILLHQRVHISRNLILDNFLTKECFI